MNFFKTLIATTLGTLIALFLILIILFLSIISSSAEPEPYIRNNTVLKVKISGSLPAHTSPNPFEEFIERDSKNNVSLETLKENLAKAKVHDKIQGVWLEIDVVNEGWANLQEAHKFISSFRDSSDKFVYASTNDIGYNEQGYYLATAADSIFSPPESYFEFDGFFSQVVFLTGLFEKIGVEAEVIRHGKYKSAVEPFYRKELSEESEFQLQQIVNTISNTFIEAVSRKTGKSTEQLNQLLNSEPHLTAHFGYRQGLIDSLLYADELEKHIKKRIGIEESSSLQTVSNSRYVKVDAETAGIESPVAQDKIAVIYASGEIMPEINSGSPFDRQRFITTSFFEEQLEEVRTDKNVKALVIRLNSPGGSGSTSDAIWKMIRETKKDLPVIVSMGPVAASGGYYLAMAADSIVAEPTTITGSIGVFATKFNARQLFNDELGITFDEVKSHEHASWLVPSNGLSASEEKALQQFVDGFYNTFITKVAEARGMTKEEVDEVAQGRVWTGEDARKENLIDILGGMDTALQVAAQKAGLEEYDLVTYPKPKGLYQVLLGSAEAQARSWLSNAWFDNRYAREAAQKLSVLKKQGPLVYFPYEITIQ